MHLTNTNNSLRISFTVAVAILPLLATYSSGIPGFSAADVVLVCFFIVTLLRYRSPLRNNFAVSPNLIYIAIYLIVLLSLISLATQKDAQFVNVAIRTIRYFFYLSVVGVCSRRILDIPMCEKAVVFVCIAATSYIVLQFALYHTSDVILKGFLPFLSVYEEGYATTNYESIYSSMYRPTSFFLEPAHYARYQLIGLAVCLFSSNSFSHKNRSIFVAIFISIGILISTSAQGYLLMFIIWLVWIVKQLCETQNNTVRNVLLCLIPFLPLIIYAVFSTQVVELTIKRALNWDVSNTNTAIGARIGGLQYYIDLPFLYKIIGCGFGVVPEHAWLSSAAYWLYGSGIIVFLLYLIYGLICIKPLHGAKKCILLVFLALFFSDDSFYSYMCIIFISLSLLAPRKPEDCVYDNSIYCSRTEFRKRYMYRGHNAANGSGKQRVLHHEPGLE